MFSMQRIPSSNGDLNCSFDNCANCCSITQRAVNELNLEGKPTIISIRTAIGLKQIDSNMYAVPLIDKHNTIHFVKALEIESISEVARFVGKEGEDFQYDGTIPTILSKSSMRLKVLVASGEENQEKIANLIES